MRAATLSAADHGADAQAAPGAPWWDKGVLALLGLALLWAPIPLGGNRPWAAALMAMGLWLLLLAATGARALAGVPMAWQVWRRAWLFWLPLAAYTGLIGLQLLAGQERWAGVLGTPELSQTRFYLLVSLSHLGLAMLVLLCAHNARRVQQVLLLLMSAGAFQAALAVLMYASRSGYQLFFREFGFNGRLSGTFPNPDHLAGYMELCLSAGFGLLVSQFAGSGGGASSGSRRWQRSAQQVMTFLLSTKMLLRLVLIVMVVALVMTHSRMGNAAFFIALMLVGLVIAVLSRKLRKPALWLVGSMLVIDLFIVGQWVGLDRVVERWQDTAASTALQAEAMALPDFGGKPNEGSVQERFEVPKLSMQLVPAFPWFGHGAGTYYLHLPIIKPPGFPHVWDHAHNDYVEIAVDTGLVGLGLLLLAAVATAGRALILLRDSQPRLHRGVAAAALMALTCMALHSLVDFNLQIPANAGALVVLMALVWAVPADQPLVVAGPGRAPRRGAQGVATGGVVPRRGDGRATWGLVAAAVAVLNLGLWWRGGPTLVADFSTQGARQLAAACVKAPDKVALADLDAAVARLQAGQQWAPDYAVLRDMEAQLLACKGAHLWDRDEAASIEAYRAAVPALKQSLLLRPRHGGTWASLAVALYGADAEAPEIVHAWREAHRLGPYESGVQLALFNVGLRLWGTAPADIRDWVLAQYKGATPGNRAVLRSLAERLGQPQAFVGVE